MKRRLILNILTSFTFLAMGSLTVLSAPGDLDTSFGGTGTVILPNSSSTIFYKGVRRFSDGKLLVFGSSGYLAAVRLLTNGDVDHSFGYDGNLSWYDVPPNPYVPGVATDAEILPDGKIVIVGKVKESSGDTQYKPAVWMFDSDGVLDQAFGTHGRVILSSTFGEATAVEVYGSKLYMIFTRDSGTYITRRTFSGGLDLTFGTFGLAQISTSQSYLYPHDMKISNADGKIYVANSRLKRYNNDGSADNTFGFFGVAPQPTYNNCTSMSDPDNYTLSSIEMDPAGRLLATGAAYKDIGGVWAQLAGVSRYNANGTVDTTFNHGQIVCGGGQVAPVPGATAQQADGKILFASQSNSTPFQRLKSNGAFDPSYASSNEPFPRDVIVQPTDGKAIVLYSDKIQRLLP